MKRLFREYGLRPGGAPLRIRNLLMAMPVLFATRSAIGHELLQDYVRAATEVCAEYKRDPVRHKQCYSRQIKLIPAQDRAIDTQSVSRSRRDQARLACRAQIRRGVAEYDSCLRNQLHLATTSVGPDSGGGSRSLPAAPRDLDASSLFKLIEPSIYIVRAKAEGGHYKLGTAVAIDPHHLLTNCHVVVDSQSISLSDGRNDWQAGAFTGNAQQDSCVVETEIGVAPVAAYRRYQGLVIGEKVYALGNPSGLEKTFSEGIISGLRRHEQMGLLVQTTAAIAQGSSGGGLFDARGNLVGINTFFVGEVGSLNFAIATEQFVKDFPQVRFPPAR